jgi:hypothetical protein
VLGVFKGLFSRKDSLIDKADMAVQKLTEYRVSYDNFNHIYLEELVNALHALVMQMTQGSEL